jgi:hypothetical protein
VCVCVCVYLWHAVNVCGTHEHLWVGMGGCVCDVRGVFVNMTQSVDV